MPGTEPSPVKSAYSTDIEPSFEILSPVRYKQKAKLLYIINSRQKERKRLDLCAIVPNVLNASFISMSLIGRV